MLKVSAAMAIGIGALLIVAQLARNFGHWDTWMNWAPDVAAGALMIFGGARALRSATDRLLIAGWAFAAGLFLSASASHWLAMSRVPEAFIPVEQRIALITAALFAATLVGVGLILLGPRVGSGRRGG